MSSLFISYSRKDIEAARRLTEAFKAQKLDFWIDWEGIPPTVDWWKEIQKGIEEADIFLFLISPDSARSRVCKQEIDHAVKNGKRLIPVVVRDIKAEEAPSELSALNWVYLRETDDFTSAVGKLIVAIKTDYAWAQVHRQLQVKALEWERSGSENSFLLRGKELQDAELQLATNTSKEPHPTDLQREYVHQSRQSTDRQRQIVTTSAIGVAILMLGLAAYAIVQAKVAAKRALISRARELAAQSVALRNSDLQTSLLLGVESFKSLDIVQTRSVLLDNAQDTPHLKAYLYGQTDDVVNVTFSPNGKMLASLSQDDTIFLWDMQTLQPLAGPIRLGISWISRLGFSPDGGKLELSNSDTIILFDIKTGQYTSQPLGWDGVPDHATSFVRNGMANQEIRSPNRNIQASIISDDNTILLSNLETGQQIYQPLKGHSDTIGSLVFSPDSKILASGSWDGTILLWDTETGQPLSGPLNANAGGIFGMALNPHDGKTLAAVTRDTVILWDVETQQRIGQPLTGSVTKLHSVAFSPDGKTLVTGGWDGSVILWEMEKEAGIADQLSVDTGSVRSLAFSPDGKILAAGTLDGTVTFWDAKTGRVLGQPLYINTGSLHSVAFNPKDKGNILAGASGDTIFLWNVGSRRPIGQPLRKHSDVVYSVAFSPDGKTLASGGEDTNIILWDVATGKPIGQPLRGHKGAIRSVAFSPNGEVLASGSEDNIAILWNAKTGQPIGQPLKGHLNPIWSIAFSPDGKTLATGSLDSTILLWEVMTGQRLGAPLGRNAGDVLSLVFSPDGKMLISGSDNNTITLWDMETQQPIGQPLSGHTDSVFAIALSPNGKTLVSGGYDPFIILWDLDSQSWIQKTCQRIRRNFIQVQWIQYFGTEEYRKTCEEFPRHPSFYQEFAKNILLDSKQSQQVQKALREVKLEMEKDTPIKYPTVESSRIVGEMVISAISEEVGNKRWEEALSLLDQADTNHLSLGPLLQDDGFMKRLCWIGGLEGYASQVLEYCVRAAEVDPNGHDSYFADYRNFARTLASEPSSTDDINLLWDLCQDGSLDGYADRVLEYCEHAVDLAPDDPDLHDHRGVARAMTGNFDGAIADFQFFVDHAPDLGYAETLIQERQKWILDLEAGINPFTSEVIRLLKDQ